MPTKHVHEDASWLANEFGGGERSMNRNKTGIRGAAVSVGGECIGRRLGAGVGGERSGLVVKTR